MNGSKVGNGQVKMKDSKPIHAKQSGGQQNAQSDKNVLVVDSAASWMVCAGAFCIFLLFSAFGRAITIFFLDFVEVFKVSITMTSLSFTFQLMAISISALLVMNVVVPVTGERVAAFVGCFVSGVCTIGVAYSPNITVFHIFMGIKGLCTGMAFITSTSILSQYFEKRRSLATALSFCGLGVGSMFTPPLVELLREEYGLNGVFLILAGLELHAVAAAMLLRPLSCYSRVISQAELKSTQKVDPEKGNAEMDALLTENAEVGDITEDNTQQQCHNGFRPCSYDGDGDVIIKEIINQEIMVESSLKDKDIKNSNEISLNGFTTNSKNSAAVDLNSITFTNNYQDNRRRTLSLRDDERNVYQDTTEPISYRDVSKRLLETQLSADLSLERNCKLNGSSTHSANLSPAKSLQGPPRGFGETERSRKSPLLHIQRGMSHPANGGHLNASETHTSSTWSIASAPLCEMAVDAEVLALENAERRAANHGKPSHNLRKTTNTSKRLESGPHMSRQVSKAESKSSKMNISCWSQTRDAFLGMFSKELMRTWCMRFLLMSCATGSAANYLVAYLPTLATKSGLGPSDVALLMTINGAVDLISRISIGFFSDLHILTPGQITAITQICLGTVMHFTRFYTDYYTILFLCVMAGMFGGIRQNMSSLITIEFMGMARFRRALGFAAMVSTLSLAVYHPLLSAILEATESFAPPLNCAGVFCYIGAAFNLMAPLAKRLDAAKNKTDEKKQVECSRPS